MRNDSYERYAKALIRLRAKAYPFAMLNANNMLGEKMWVEWKKEYRRSMTIRNTWTIRSLKLVKSRRPVIKGMRTIVGTRLQYLKTNEAGGKAEPKGSRKHGMMSPANAARSGGAYNKLVTRATKRKQIGKVTSGDRKQANAAQIKQAQKDRSKLAMIEGEGGGIGFYKMRKGSKKSKAGGVKKGKLFWTLIPEQKIQKNNAMQRAFRTTHKFKNRYFKLALKREIAEVKRRARL